MLEYLLAFLLGFIIAELIFGNEVRQILDNRNKKSPEKYKIVEQTPDFLHIESKEGLTEEEYLSIIKRELIDKNNNKN